MKRTTRYEEYRKEVMAHTAQSREELGWEVLPEYTDVDHIIPIAYGFKKKILPEHIGHKDNLQIMRRNPNIEKGQSITPRGIEKLIHFGYDELAEWESFRIAQRASTRRAA